MKRHISILTCLFLLISLFAAGCGFSGRLDRAPADIGHLEGVWNGCGSAMGKGQDYRGEYLNLTFRDDGTFSLDDVERGTTSFAGLFSIDKDSYIHIDSKTEEDSSLPAGWGGLAAGDSIRCRLPEDDRLILTYHDVSYFFKKQGAEDIPLLDLVETDVWHSDSGNADEAGYELALYDNYMELSSTDPKDGSKSGPAANFFYLSHDGSQYQFCTWTEDKTALPKVLQSLPEGMSEADIKLTCDGDSLVLEYRGRSLTFYSNVLYGLGSGMDASSLQGSCFIWKFDAKKHFCYFTVHPDTGVLYLYVQESKKNGGADTVCGEVAVDEKNQMITYTFDKKASRKTCGKDSSLFQFFKKLCGRDQTALISYRLKKSSLKFILDEGKGKSYQFHLKAYGDEDD